ncbi:MAG: glutamine-hydrolyzing carbamoyl-phosphate synthase small subunit [Alphaproteobacteria bacterium GM7ARS4]|nr:glutamine-hydrolyzing carbamoyl-phosphate synthase small subunit [Alphaproteobacteria bacterium GM7ARS4]
MHAQQEITAALVLGDGFVCVGQGVGCEGMALGELCFNTSMTGYQEILTDPSYCGQIVLFTFPHIGNVGTNDEDNEAARPFVRGCVLATPITPPSNHRSIESLDGWLVRHGLIALCGVQTRVLVHRLRDKGCLNGGIVHRPQGLRADDIDDVRKALAHEPPMEGRRLDLDVTTREDYLWREGLFRGYGETTEQGKEAQHTRETKGERPLVVVIDYGVKRALLRHLYEGGVDVRVVPSSANAAAIMAYDPDGIVLSNGPGDPRATFECVSAVVRCLIESRLPVLGICLGHQLLCLGLGGRVMKMPFGHHGGNQPVRCETNGRIDITSQNHGFTVVEESLDSSLGVTHHSLFDGTVEGMSLDGRLMAVQYHPEASPGPLDSTHIIRDFCVKVRQSKGCA